MSTPGNGYVSLSDCSTAHLYNTISNERIVAVVRDIENVARQYIDGSPGILIGDHKLTKDNCVFIKVVCTFKFPL
jgi:hypothetical protein